MSGRRGSGGPRSRLAAARRAGLTVQGPVKLIVHELRLGHLLRHKVEELVPLDVAIAADVNLLDGLTDFSIGGAQPNHSQRVPHLLQVPARADHYK